MNRLHPSKTEDASDFNSDSSEISIIWRFLQQSNAYSHNFDTFDGIKIVSILDSEKAFDSIICKLEFVGILTLVRLSQISNAFSHIFDTFDGIKIDSIFVLKNTFDSIICKLEFVGISTLLRFLQKQNAYPHI